MKQNYTKQVYILFFDPLTTGLKSGQTYIWQSGFHAKWLQFMRTIPYGGPCVPWEKALEWPYIFLSFYFISDFLHFFFLFQWLIIFIFSIFYFLIIFIFIFLFLFFLFHFYFFNIYFFLYFLIFLIFIFFYISLLFIFLFSNVYKIKN